MSACDCDQPERLVLNIPAGLDALPRQLWAFPQVREALLRAVGTKPALTGWQARGERDLGRMWLEMWAYVADVLNFYDERIANESYLRTAVLQPSIRRHLELLGFIQNPGVAGSVSLALIADGRKPVTLPPATGFRSDAFADQPPQVFEISEQLVIHPLQNEFVIGGGAPATLPQQTPTQAERDIEVSPGQQVSFLVFETADFGLARDRIVLFEVSSGNEVVDHVSVVKDFRTIEAPNGKNFVEVELKQSVNLGSSIDPSSVRVRIPTTTAVLTDNRAVDSAGNETDDQALSSGNNESLVTLNTVQPQLRLGDPFVTLVGATEPVAGRVVVVREQRVALPIIASGGTTTITVDGDEIEVEAPDPPATTIVVTQATVDVELPTGIDEQLTFHFNFVDGGTLATLPTLDVDPTALSEGAGLPVEGVVQAPPGAEPRPGSSDRELDAQFLLQDQDEVGALVNGVLRFTKSGRTTFNLKEENDDAASELPTFKAPLTLFGNVVTATRGESVFGEAIGSGDPRVANQRFGLKKKPLTYLDAPADPRGFKSTLRIRVNGVEWQEVKSFFGCGPEDQVYIVRHDDERNTRISFGDGVRGARLPSGVKNVVADYRFGSGSAVPPAGSIEQLATAVDGLSSVLSPVAAKPGRDPDDAAKMRAQAQRSLLTLGRAVSIVDLQALAASVAGVLKVTVEYDWLEAQQQVGVKLRYIGDTNVSKVSQRLREQSDPNLVIDIAAAKKAVRELMLSVSVDPRYELEVVGQAVHQRLVDPETGLLAPKNAEIGGQFFMSRLYAEVLEVPGTVDVSSANLGSVALGPQDVLCPPKDSYFDFDGGQNVVVTPVRPKGTVLVPGHAGRVTALSEQ